MVVNEDHLTIKFNSLSSYICGTMDLITIINLQMFPSGTKPHAKNIGVNNDYTITRFYGSCTIIYLFKMEISHSQSQVQCNVLIKLW